MASFNTPIVTTQGLALLKSAIAGTDTLTFTHLIFSADDYTNSTDSQVASLTDISSKDMTTVPQSFTDTNGNVKVRAVGYNQSTSQAFNIKSYALYATNKAGAELLFAVSTSQTADFVPAYNGKQLNQVAYTFNFSVASANNITFSDTHDIAVTQADLASINAEIQAVQNGLAHIDLSGAVNQAKSYTDNSVNSLSAQLVSSVATNTNAINTLQSSVNANSSAIASNATNIANTSSAISSLQSNVSTNVTSNVNSLGNQINSLSSSTAQSISAVQSSVNANSSAISSNATNIANNSNAISTNSNAVTASVNQINSNLNNLMGQVNSAIKTLGEIPNNTLSSITTTGIYGLSGENPTDSPAGQIYGQLIVVNVDGVVNQTLMNNVGSVWTRSVNSWGITPWVQSAGVAIFPTASQAQSYAQTAPAGTIVIATGN